jgi:hypothetical protein
MSRLREYLQNLLTRKVETYGLVVWDDPHREYEAVARELCPPDTRFERWDGSWYRLRRTIEPLISGLRPPRLVVYLPVEGPPREEDPLAEVREAGTVFKLRLATLIKEALGKVLTAARIEELTAAKTFPEAEAALSAGEGTGTRLPVVLGTADPIQLCLRILADSTDGLISAEGLWEEARRVLAHASGGSPSGEGDLLRYRVFRHLVFLELEQALGSLPPQLAQLLGEPSREQRARAGELLRVWRRDIDRLPSYRQLALRLEQDLDLLQHLEWGDGLVELDTIPAIEQLALKEVLRLLELGDAARAAELARKRLRSIWVRGSVEEAATWGPRWRAVTAVAELLCALAETAVPRTGDVDGFLRWYAESGWRVDQLHRHMEMALAELAVLGDLDRAVTRARGGYEHWLEELLERFTTAIEREGLDTRLTRQWSVHKEWLAKADALTAYILVDALRYELGQELAHGLQKMNLYVELVPVVASVPTITSVGMASLLPGAEFGIRLDLSGSKLAVEVNGVPVRNVADRVAILRRFHGELVELSLSEILEFGERELRKRIGSSPVVLVRSQEIDDAFESDHVAAQRYVTETRTLIERAIARLAAAGIGRFVLASDHGFLLSRRLDQSRVVDPPGGEGYLHRRFWLGSGGTAPPSTLRLPLAEVGIGGELDLIVPRGLAIFRAAGARRFLHGGLSPQELLVPVIEVRARVAQPPAVPGVHVRIAGDRITTGVFSTSLSLQPDLFTSELRVRLVARNQAGTEVARPVAGDFEEATGTLVLTAAPESPTRIVTFRVTSPLRKGDRLTITVHDANSDRVLATTAAQVVTDVGVDDET